MKTLIFNLTMSLGVLANVATAEINLHVDGEDIPLSTLMGNCQSMVNNPGAQVSCFNALTQLLDEQSGGASATAGLSVPDAFTALRNAAEYQDDDTGLLISGDDCNIEILYFGNYYHISRRNISSLDLYSATFDASQVQLDQSINVPGAQALLSKVVMTEDAMAASRGGAELESAQYNFAPRSPRTSLDNYANEVVDQLPATDSQTVEFVLVHPERSDASADIWKAFEGLVSACQT